MKAMLLKEHSDVRTNEKPLVWSEVDEPKAGAGEILLKVSACGVCHTELDEIEGRAAPPVLPIIPGHQVVGLAFQIGPEVTGVKPGARLGVGWIFSACGHCEFCLSGHENLCPDFVATGKDANGGYAQYISVPAGFCLPIPDSISDLEAAPLLCAGAIGYRSLNLANLHDSACLGLTGFGSSAHLVIKMAQVLYPNASVLVFSRSPEERQFAMQLGASWAGDLDDRPPKLLDAIIDTTPAWKPVIRSLEALKPGGRLVINAIRKENVDQDWLANLDYPTHLWQEKEVKSVANVTRRDISEFLALAARAGIHPEVQVYPLEDANQALMELKNRQIKGAKVLQISW